MAKFFEIVLFVVFLTPTAHAYAPTWQYLPLPRLLTYEQVTNLVYETADRYGANKGEMLKTVECESPKLKIDGVIMYDTQGQSNQKYKNGNREESFGLSQIHLPAHPDITKQQAQDPHWSLDWMANEFAEGRASKWSCYQLLGYKNSSNGSI